MGYKYTLLIKPDPELKELYEKHGTYNDGDSGLDLFLPCDVEFKNGQTTKVNYGIKCEMIREDDEGVEENVGYYLYHRSSISKTPLGLANHYGIIDAGYRGHIIGMFRCMSLFDGPEFSHHGKMCDRYVQLCAPDLSPFNVEIVDELSETTRGEGGIGSTGK